MTKHFLDYFVEYFDFVADDSDGESNFDVVFGRNLDRAVRDMGHQEESGNFKRRFIARFVSEFENACNANFFEASDYRGMRLECYAEVYTLHPSIAALFSRVGGFGSTNDLGYSVSASKMFDVLLDRYKKLRMEKDEYMNPQLWFPRVIDGWREGMPFN